VQRKLVLRTIQRRIGWPSTRRYLELAYTWQIINCNVTRQDIVNADDIFGPVLGSLKGKTIRKASDQVQAGGLVPIPLTIMKQYWQVVLCVDVMKVNKMPFLVTMSRAIKFGTVAWLKNAISTTIIMNIKEVQSTSSVAFYSRSLRPAGSLSPFVASLLILVSPSTNVL
jgi:hypothetical protein